MHDRWLAATLWLASAVSCLLIGGQRPAPAGEPAAHAPRADWYGNAIFIYHLDNHPLAETTVDLLAEVAKMQRMVPLCRPDVVQAHARGREGWTTYPSSYGFTPRDLQDDFLRPWRNLAAGMEKPFGAYYNFGRGRQLVRTQPEFSRLEAGGKLYDNVLCYHSGVVEKYLWPQIREVIANYHPDAIWFDGSCWTINVCYCAACEGRWKARGPLPIPRSPSAPGWDDFKEMQRETYRRVVHETAKMIHELSPKCLVTFNLAYTAGMPEPVDPEIDCLSRDVGNGVGALSMHAAFMDSQEKPFDVMTGIFYQDEEDVRKVTEFLLRRMYAKPDEQLLQEIAVILSKGAKYSAWDAPTFPKMGLVEEHLSLLSRIGPWLQQRREWCLHTRNRADVSILHSADSFYAQQRARPDVYPLSGAHDLLYAATGEMDSRHILYEIVPDWKLDQGKIAGKALVAEDLYVLRPERVAAMKRYVEEGGTLLATGQGALTGGPEMRQLLGIERVDIAPLSGSFAVRAGNHGSSSLAAQGTAAGLRSATLFRVKESNAGVLLWAAAETATTTAGKANRAGEALPEELPLLTVRKLGRGNAFYCAAPLFTFLGAHKDRDGSGPGSAMAALASRILSTVLPEEDRTLELRGPPEMHVTCRTKGDTNIVHLVNMAHGDGTGQGASRRIVDIPAAEPCRLMLRTSDRPRQVSLEPGGRKPADWSYADGLLQVAVPGFPIHEMVVIHH